MSSPPIAAPQLRSEIFSSPVRQQYNPNAPRTPGVSIHTPAKGQAQNTANPIAKKDEISWESDSDQDADDVYKELGMSPPKTIQFAIPPSRLLQTPGNFNPISYKSK
jgi:DASH complex subunit ASK1